MKEKSLFYPDYELEYKLKKRLLSDTFHLSTLILEMTGEYIM